MNKNEIRALLLKQRMSFSPEDIQSCTAAIAGHFINGSFSPVQCLLSYFPLFERNEPEVSACEKHMLALNTSMILAMPRIGITQLDMHACRIDETTVYQKNKYGIVEPVNGTVIDPKDIQMIFVPLIGFDVKGNRVGYGKGYYDRYLSQCRENVLRVGFSCFEPVPQISDISHFDVPLTHCITPLRIYEF